MAVCSLTRISGAPVSTFVGLFLDGFLDSPYILVENRRVRRLQAQFVQSVMISITRGLDRDYTWC